MTDMRMNAVMFLALAGLAQGCVGTPSGSSTPTDTEDMSMTDMSSELDMPANDMSPGEEMGTEEDLDPPIDMAIEPDMPADMPVEVDMPVDMACEPTSCESPLSAPACDGRASDVASCVDSDLRCRDGQGCVSPDASCMLSKATVECAAVTDRESPSSDVHSMGRALAVSADGQFLAVGAPAPQQGQQIGTNQVLLYQRSTNGRTWEKESFLIESDYMEFGARMVWGEPDNENAPIPLFVAAPRWQPEGFNEPVGMIRGYLCTPKVNEIVCEREPALDLEGLAGQLQFFGNRFQISPDGEVLFASYRGRSTNGNPDFASSGVGIFRRQNTGWCLVGRIEGDRVSNRFGVDMQVAWAPDKATLVIGAPGAGSGAFDGFGFVLDVNFGELPSTCIDQLGAAPVFSATTLDVEESNIALAGAGVAISPSGETIAVSIPTLLVQGKTQGGFVIFRKDETSGEWKRQYDVRGSAPGSYFRAGGDAGPASMGQRMAFFGDDYLVAVGEYDSSENETNDDCVFRTNDRLELHLLREEGAELMWSKNTPLGTFSKYGSDLVPLVNESTEEVRLLSGTEGRGQTFARPIPGESCAYTSVDGSGGFTDELLVVTEDFDLFQ